MVWYLQLDYQSLKYKSQSSRFKGKAIRQGMPTLTNEHRNSTLSSRLDEDSNVCPPEKKIKQLSRQGLTWSQDMENQIRCKVFPGQFSTEYAVRAVQANGEWFSLFVPVDSVEVDDTVTRERAVDGWLKVSVWERKGDKVIVKLPRESFESGRFVTISVANFRTLPESAGV